MERKIKYNGRLFPICKLASKLGVSYETLDRYLGDGFSAEEVYELNKKRGRFKSSIPLIVKIENLSGQRFGKLKVLRRVHPKKNGQTAWLCQCSCGNKTVVGIGVLKNGNTRSCGCLTFGKYKNHREYHGLTNTPEMNIWNSMRQRCVNKSNSNYSRYGARGIFVCKRWLGSFKNFIDDMGRRPSGRHTIERINNNGGYMPSNCKWATYKEQNRNNKRNVFYWHDGKKKCLSEWAEILGVKRHALEYHLKYKHRTIKEVIDLIK